MGTSTGRECTEARECTTARTTLIRRRAPSLETFFSELVVDGPFIAIAEDFKRLGYLFNMNM